MPQVPLPAVGTQVGASVPFTAPGVTSAFDVAGKQIEQLGAAATETGLRVNQIAAVLQDDIDDAATKEAYTRFADYAQSVLLAPDSGYLHKIGKAAVGDSRAHVLDAIEKKRQELERSLLNENQRNQFSLRSRAHTLDVRTKVWLHEGEQMRVYNLGQTKAMRLQSVQDAANSYLLVPPDADQQAMLETAAAAQKVASTGTSERGLTVPQDPQQARIQALANAGRASATGFYRKTALAQADEEARLRGYELGSALHKQLRLDTTTAIHEQVVNGFLASGQTERAAKYLAGTEPTEIDPIVRANLQHDVERQTFTDQAARVAIATVGEAEAAARDKGYPLERMLVDTRQILEAKFKRGEISSRVMDKAWDDVKEVYSARQQARAGDAKVAMDQAKAFWSQNPAAELPAALYNKLDRLEMLGVLPALRAQVSRPRAIALGKMISETEESLKPLEDEINHTKRILGQIERGKFAGTREAAEAVKKQLPILLKQQAQLRTNITLWKAEQVRLLGGMADVDTMQPSKDAIDMLLDKIGGDQ
jgi:hypothetical protein